MDSSNCSSHPSTGPTAARAKLALETKLLALVAYLPWLAVLGWLSSVAWFLCDDAFISFRYVRNLLSGHGLVFNPGEYVEGYTNFLWILELAAIWGIFGVRPEHGAPWLSVAYTVGTVAVTLLWVARLPSLESRALIGWMALGLLCSSATFAVWTSAGGLETRQFTFFFVLAVVCLTLHRNGRGGLVSASLCLAAAELTRPEGLMLAAVCFSWFTAQLTLKEGRVSARTVRQILWLVVPFTVIVLAHYLGRYAYYGEWLPNTYYAKHVRSWYESGFRYLGAAALETGLYLILPLAFYSLLHRWRTHRDASYALAMLAVCVHIAYLLPIGGDLFEYRPLDFYWPLLSLPAAQGLFLLGSKLTGLLVRQRMLPSVITGNSVTAIAIFLPVAVYANSVQAVLLFEATRMAWHVDRPHFEINQKNAAWLLELPAMSAIASISNDLRDQTNDHWVGLRAAVHRRSAEEMISRWKRYENMDRGAIPPYALIAHGALGKFYYLSDLRVFDFFGLTDATVARTPVSRPNSERIIAHDRYPTLQYLGQRGVNLNIGHPSVPQSEAQVHVMYTAKVGPDLWLPFNSNDFELATKILSGTELDAAPPLAILATADRVVRFDAGISLLEFSLEQNRFLWLETKWETTTRLDADLKTSLRLYSATEENIWANDQFLVTIDNRLTRRWDPSIPVPILNLIDISPDTPPGNYELRLVVYNSQTLDPSAEIDLWETEIVLAQLKIQ